MTIPAAYESARSSAWKRAAPAGGVSLRRRALSRLSRVVLAATLLGAGLCACGGSESPSAVARVGSIEISKETLNRWAALERRSGGSGGEGQSGRLAALSGLIGANQLIGEAESMHVAASTQEAEERLQELEFDRIRKLQFVPASALAPYAQMLTAAQGSRSDELLLLRLDATAAKLEHQVYARAERRLTRGQVAAYYASNVTKYTLPERRKLEVIGNYSRAVILKAKREVEQGGDFLAIARRVSIDQEAPGGLEPPLARGEEEPEYDRVVFPAKRGVLYGPYKQAFFFIFKVLKITPAKRSPLATVEDAVRRDAVAARKRQIMAGFYRELEGRWNARTVCRPAYVVSRCGRTTDST